MSSGVFGAWSLERRVFGTTGVWSSGCLYQCVFGVWDSWVSPLSSEFVTDVGETCDGRERVGTEWGLTGGVATRGAGLTRETKVLVVDPTSGKGRGVSRLARHKGADSEGDRWAWGFCTGGG